MSKRVKLAEAASVVRSKNAGPYELTLDIIFPDPETYRKAKGQINPELIARLYRIPQSKIIAYVEFDPAYAIKATMERPRASGDLGETDVYGAQQHAPLLGIELEL